MTIRVTIPYPVSSNRYWRSFVPRGHQRAIVVLSDEAKAFKARVRHEARSAGINTPIAGRVAVSIRLYPQRPQDAARRAAKNPTTWDDDVRSIDLDNAAKVLIDALKDVAFGDDRMVWRLDLERMEPDGAARAEVTISAIAAADPRGALDLTA